jgi:hypothetical protein
MTCIELRLFQIDREGRSASGAGGGLLSLRDELANCGIGTA